MKSLFLGILLSIFVTLPSYAYLSVSPASMSFSTKVGMTAMGTAFVRNQSNKQTSINVSGFCGQDITVQNSCFSVPAYGSCTIHVNYRPMRPGTSNCNVSIRDSAGGFSNLSIFGRTY